jgi:subtilisin family serine protease
VVHKHLAGFVLAVLLVFSATGAFAAPNGQQIGVNVALRGKVTSAIRAELNTYGTVLDVLDPINALTMRAPAGNLNGIRALPYVSSATADAERIGGPVADVPVIDFADGINVWDLDAINVTDFQSTGRSVAFDGSGVYVAVLDTGLVEDWRSYFPAERIATEYARAFGGGGGERGTVSSQPDKWQKDTNSHGTHVTGTILGYSLSGIPDDLGGPWVNGVAPRATVIPVKVLSQGFRGFGWASRIARGILYVADLKAGPLKSSPVVINMSLGGSELDAVEKAALDYAIGKGVIIVASAGNEGTSGMGYPGAYAPVISVAASGWVGQWTGPTRSWPFYDVSDPTNPDDFYIADFSSRQLNGQDLDVAAPGAWIVGPYQFNAGQITYGTPSGTSMAAPHVAGIVALMLQKSPTLSQSRIEAILEAAAIPIPPGSRQITDPDRGSITVSWGADATGSGLITADGALNATQ